MRRRARAGWSSRPSPIGGRADLLVIGRADGVHDVGFDDAARHRVRRAAEARILDRQHLRAVHIGQTEAVIAAEGALIGEIVNREDGRGLVPEADPTAGCSGASAPSSPCASRGSGRRPVASPSRYTTARRRGRRRKSARARSAKPYTCGEPKRIVLSAKMMRGRASSGMVCAAHPPLVEAETVRGGPAERHHKSTRRRGESVLVGVDGAVARHRHHDLIARRRERQGQRPGDIRQAAYFRVGGDFRA